MFASYISFPYNWAWVFYIWEEPRLEFISAIPGGPFFSSLFFGGALGGCIQVDAWVSV